jgi:hypothetical protein
MKKSPIILSSLLCTFFFFSFKTYVFGGIVFGKEGNEPNHKSKCIKKRSPLIKKNLHINKTISSKSERCLEYKSELPYTANGGELNPREIKEKKEHLPKKSTKSISLLGNESIENIPFFILCEICHKLTPLDIVHLSRTSKMLKKKITDRLWENYLKHHKQKKWKLSVPSIKVTFAYSLLEAGKIKEAAQLGFPEAIKAMKKSTNPQYPNSYVNTVHSTENKYIFTNNPLNFLGFPSFYYGN